MPARMGGLTLLLVALVDFFPAVQGSALRSPVRHRTVLIQGSGERIGEQKTYPPFDIDPETFIPILQAVPTDILLLFYSPTCPDCEKLMPQWTKVAAAFENDQDITLFSVADDEGKAPAPYVHTENPEIFFIPKGKTDAPVKFPLSDLHSFVAMPESAATDSDIVSKMISFAKEQRSGSAGASAAGAAPAVQPPKAPVSQAQAGQAKAAQPAAPSDTAVEDSLNARLLAVLKQHEHDPLEAQLQIVRERPYATLPVAMFLSSVTEPIPAPLAEMAARYLDGEPLARKWAQRYAMMEENQFHGRGWDNSPEEEMAHYKKLVDYAVPFYARSIYVQKGGATR